MRDRSPGSRTARVLDLSLGMMRSVAMKIKYFKSAHDFRRWLEKNHAITQELWVGYHKKSSRQPSITWPESVDEALCFGWIDGIRKSVDDLRYTSRFTPRRRGSIWSAVNIKRARELSEKGLMKPPGMAAFNARKENKSGIYSYEQRSANLATPYEKRLRQNKAAWDFFYAQPPPYRKAIGWWIVSAKQEATRLKRLEKLIEGSANRKRLL